MDFSERLDEAMRRAGYKSQHALARAAGISQSTVNRLLQESGTVGPEMATVKKLADACGVSFEWLHAGVVSRTPVEQKMPNLSLVYVDEEELRILTLYRESNEAGKHFIIDAAEQAAKSSPPPASRDES
jgi:transcriptional regulator with XRE-family HTH domain